MGSTCNVSYLHKSSLTFKNLFHMAPKLVSWHSRNWCPQSVARRWQLASLRRLLQVASQLGVSQRIQRNGWEWLGATSGRSERRSVTPQPWPDLLPVGRRGPVIFISSDILKCTWLASDLQQTPNLIQLYLPGYRRLTPISMKPWCHGGTNA